MATPALLGLEEATFSSKYGFHNSFYTQVVGDFIFLKTIKKTKNVSMLEVHSGGGVPN